MTKRAELADGRVLEFPDDTPMEVIQRVVKEQIAASKAPAPVAAPVAAAPAPVPVAAAPTAEARLQARQPLKEVEAPGLFDYFTNRQAAIKQSRERAAYMQELGQRGALEDIKTQTGFFDRLGDMFSRGLLSTTASIKDTQRAIETDPELKKQFTEEARRFAADQGVEIKGATTEEDVKKNFLRSVVPYVLEKGAESIPGMLAAAVPIPGLGLATNLGGQARTATELGGRQDVEFLDLLKVAPGAIAVSALDQIGLGGILAAPAKTALGRIGKAALLEGGTEAIQSAIEYANPRVVTGSDIDAGEMFEQAAFGALVGGGIGGGGRGGIEAVSAALNRGKKEAETETDLANSPQVEQEYLRLLTAETQALREQNPDLTQRQAFNQAVKGAGKLYDTAIVNTMFGPEGEANVAPDTDTGMDVTGGGGAGAAADIGTAPPVPSATDIGETVGGELERPVSGVPTPAVGEGTRVDTLTEPTAKQVKATVPAIEQAFTNAAIDFEDAYGVKKLNAEQKKQAARIVIQSPEVDPYDAIGSVLERGALLRGEKVSPRVSAAPTIETAPVAPPAPPSVDEVAVAPVKAAIEAAAAPTPTASPIPTLAEASAREVGIAPAPEVAATPAVEPTPLPAMAAPEVAAAPVAEEIAPELAPVAEEVALEPAPAEEVVAEEIAPEPTPVAEEVAPEVAAAPIEEVAPETDPYDALLEEIETARWDEEAGQQIDDKAYNLLATATENRRKPTEEIRAVLEGAKTRYAEQVMGGERFRPGEPGNITVDEVAPVVASVAQRTGVQAPNVVQSVADLPASVQGAISSGEALSPSGVVDADGNVYIVADNLNTVEEATATLFHETLGHIGLAKQFRQRLDKVLRGMYDTNRNLRNETDAWRAQNPNAYSTDADPLARAVEEVLAQRSEAGRIEASLFAKLAAIVKDFARRMRIKADFSDAEITSILAMAHDRAVREGSKLGPAGTRFQKRKAPTPAAAPTPKVVSNGKQVVLTEAQKRTALAKAKAVREKMNRIQKRIASTNDTADVLSDGIDLVKLARGDKENWALLRGAIDTVDVGRWQLILPTLSTEDIFRVLKGRIPGLTEADRIIQQDVTRFQTKEYLQLADELEQVSEFLKKYPKAAQALSDLEFASVAYQVDPTKAATPEEYAKLDKKTKELQTELSGVAAGDAKGKKKVEDKIARRLAEIKSVYVGVPGDERVLGWRDLGRPEFGGGKGREIFKLLRDGHRRDLEAKYNALRDRLKETKKDKALDEALEKLEAQFKPAMDQVIYFPAMRFGSYYARVGSGATSVFKMFETQTQRNQFVRVMKARGQEVTDTGNVEDLRNNFEQVTGGPLKGVLDLFDGDPKDIGALKSQVFDLWLQTMSAGDMRKHMAPRKMRAGYSTDILKNFANFRRSSINDVKRAKFGYKLRTQISSAKDSLEGTPDREKMNAFIKEIELRTMSDLMPADRGNPYWQGAIEFGNKMAFYQYLANPKTAIIQLTQLHIVALPMLAQKYGSAKATAALSKYGFSSLGGFVTSPLKAIKREDGKFTFDWEQPNLLDNPISALKEESDPELYELLSEGWTEGRDLNLWMDTFANQIGGYGNADPQQSSALQELMKGRVHTAAWRGTTFAFEAMGTLMHQMERVNREATYMAALELAYRENKKNGQTHAEAKKNAIEAAVETTLAATFDFSSYNKPRVLNTGVGRLAGQFMSYPYMMTSLLARNVYTAIKVSGLEPGERKAAIQTATGALLNIGLYAGLTGLPLYGISTTIASLLMWAFGDDEEEGGLSYIDEDGNIKATYNVDWWFRNVWIPKFFGPDGTVANLFGLDDETAEVVARSVEKGPISAITDIDLSNSVALDVMFFVPRESRADTPEGKVVDYTFSAVTGAAGNMVMDYIKAGKDLMNGYTARALEKTPKLFSNVAKANRFATEGQTNYNRELVGMDADFWSSDKAIMQALGFASTEADQKQQQNYEAKSINVKVEKARADFLDKLRKTALDRYQYGSTPETDAAQQQIVQDWVEFNQTYPTHVIGLDSFYEVQNNAVTAAVESYGTRGLPFDEKTPYLRDLYLRRLKTEEK